VLSATSASASPLIDGVADVSIAVSTFITGNASFSAASNISAAANLDAVPFLTLGGSVDISVISNISAISNPFKGGTVVINA